MKNKLSIKLNAVYLTMYGAQACYFPFLTIYLQDRKLSFTQIGIALAINSLVGVIAQPIWGYITDKHSDKKAVIALNMILSSVIILGLTVFKDFYIIAICLVIFICFQSSISSITDAFTYEIIEENRKLQYGQIRLMGSVGYAVVALAVGAFIKYAGVDKSFYIYSILMILSIFIIWSIKSKSRHGGKMLNVSDILELLKNKGFIVFLVSIIFINIATGANSSYISVLIQKTGGDVSRIGILWFIVAMSELPAFFFGNKLIKKYGVLNLYLISIFLYIIRFLLDSVAPSYSLVIAIQIMQGITFPLYTMASLQYVNDTVSPQMRTSAITLYAALGGGLGGFIGNMYGGVILESMNVFLLFRILSLMCLFSLLTGFILKKTKIINRDN